MGKRIALMMLVMFTVGCGGTNDANDAGYAPESADAESACLFRNSYCSCRGESRECCAGLVCKYGPKSTMTCQPEPDAGP